MEQFRNITTFLQQYPSIETQKVPTELLRLIMFTGNSKLNRDSLIKISVMKELKGSSKKGYTLQFKGKNYSFSVLSDLQLQKWDKKVLESKDRMIYGLNRTLKFACSMDLVNPRVVIGNSIVELLNPIVLYENKGKDMVIDYDHNLIMEKDSYYEIFQFQELSIVNKLDLYNIYRLLESLEFDESISLCELLLFAKEIFSEFVKTEKFGFLNSAYDSVGVNNYWYSIFGNHSESLFFRGEDWEGTKYDQLKEELDEFTKNPSVKKKHIYYDSKRGKYCLKEKRFGFFEFNLLSDIVGVLEIKEELLSDRRYNQCHYNSKVFSYCLMDICAADSVYIVGGKVKCNELNYYEHSWIEIDHRNVVVDYNHNLIMNRDQYYQLYEAVSIAKTEASNMKSIEPFLSKFDFTFHPFFLNYFGEEIARDLKKNEKILLKK